MLNLKPIRFERNGATRFGISIEWCDLSEEELDYDGLRIWYYSTDIRFAIHEIESESQYYKVLTKLLTVWGGHITATNSNAPGGINHFDLVVQISEWLTNEGHRMV